MTRASILCSTLLCAAAVAPPPDTPRDAVIDTYHDVNVADPYRWLENGSDPKVRAWSAAQNRRTRAFLGALPIRRTLHDQLTALISATSPSFRDLYPAGGKVFALYTKPPKQQPMVASLPPGADPAGARVVVDPNALDPSGATAVDWFVPSPDGSKLAVSLSENGSEDGSVHVFDVASGRELGPVIPRVQYPTGGGSLAWKADGSGFFYTRYPGDERPEADRHFYQQLYYHALGQDPSRDRYVLGRDFPRIAEIALDNRADPARVVVSVANGDGGQYEFYVIDGDAAPKPLAGFADQVVAVDAGPDGALYLVSRKGAPRGRLLRLAPGAATLADATVLVPEGQDVIQGGGEFGGEPVVATAHAIYVRELAGGPSRVARYAPDGKALADLPLPGVAAVDEVVPAGDGGVLFRVATYLRPPYFARFDEASGRVQETRLAETSPVRFDDVEVVRETATSRDGTKIPVNVVRRKGLALDGSHPALLYGYGGYDISMTPTFLDAPGRLFLDGGGVYAIANLRGGGEFGEAWHEAGAVTHKQNVFDDFTAAAQHLVDARYTTTARLGIMGESNGGLLMGAELTQHPQMFRAVVSRVGIYDMLRVERDPNGAFNVTEYGSTADPAQFRALYAYSPYHHVIKGVAYPAVFMATGANDGRVNPAHSRKMIAALQAATSSDRPILLATSEHAGHGMGSALSVRIDAQADVLAFMFDQLGMKL